MTPRAPEVGRASDEEWTEARRAMLMEQISTGRLSVEAACAHYGLGTEVVQDWLRGFRRSVVFAFDEKLKRSLADQGADAALWAAEFTGTLEETSIIDWIQSVEITRKSAVIIVSHNGMESRIWCSNGTPIDAQSGRLRGESALYRIVSFDAGRVTVEFVAVRRLETIHSSTARLLLEAAHRKDEAARLWSKLGDARRSYRVTERAKRGVAYFSQAERALLTSFDQPRTLFDVFEQSELGDVETLTLLVRLSDGQFIAADASSPPVRSTARDTGDLTASFHTVPIFAPSEPCEVPGGHVPGWAWSAAAALVLVAVAAWLRLETAASARSVAEAPHELPPPSAPVESPATARPSLAEAPSTGESPSKPESSSSYVVTTTFEPSGAAIWLDGQLLPSGPLNTTFSKDGQAHEMRAVAEGYAPALVVFVDAPPPARIRLEALPALAAAAAPGDRVAPTGKGRTTNDRRRAHRTRSQTRAEKMPSVQKIEAGTPAIQLIQ